MEEAMVALIGKTSQWVINIIMLAVGSAVIIWVWSAITVLKKNITVHATADRLLTLQSEYNNLNGNNVLLKEKYNQSLAVQAGIKSISAELKYLFYQFADGMDIQGQAYGLLKLITDRISTDLKFSAGEIHRCAVWLDVDGKNLGIYAASAGFSDYYRKNRVLEIDRSAAGRCFRTRTSRYIPNVFKDEDFYHNPNYSHRYFSLICVPLILGDVCLGVITVDGKEENTFKIEDIETVEAYSEMAAMIRMMQIASSQAPEGEEDAYEAGNDSQD